ncbi:MAG: isocitrate lyase/phosphoenolpyruvate mutase family protein [Oscillospiraceae bacterium]|nr:isocitrate lyase/phosphoenolpyruvate mutase family protein [Oscillospiraceae bacterium]
MIPEVQKEKARVFAHMHKENRLFVLPNAWNVGSAYVFEKQGFKAVGTSSAGIAHDLGFPDGEYISFDDLLWVVQKIASRIDIPLSIDFERGYSEVPEGVKENARKLLLAGAVGFNIEDGLPNGDLESLETQVAKISALAELKSELDMGFVINARTDVFPLDGADETSMQMVLERCNAFVEAGADCVFVIGAKDEVAIARLVDGVKAPVNIFLRPGIGSFEDLDKLGVRRLSVGCNAARYSYSRVIDMARDLYDGDVSKLLEHGFSSGEANAYFEK